MLSASAQVAPPCNSPNGCSLPATGMVATRRSGSHSVIRMPSLSSSGPWVSAGSQSGRGCVTPRTLATPTRGPGCRSAGIRSRAMSAPAAAPAAAPAPPAEGGRPRLLLLDGHSLAYRAFFALPVENFSTTTGQPTNAVYGFTSMLINVLRDEQPTHLAVAFDVGRKTF